MNDSIETKKDAKYEERLQHRLQILLKDFEDGKIKFAEGLQSINSLRAVKKLPNGQVDLNSVDGFVRSMALAAEHFHNRAELKKVASLSEIQTGYFNYIETIFGQPYREMLKHNATPQGMALNISNDSNVVEEVASSIPDFLNAIEEFWLNTADIAQIHIEDMTGILKGVYGGDLFPQHDQNLGSKCGIYTDTIILPDPFLRSKFNFMKWSSKDQVFYFIKHGLNLLQYKELVCADVNPPIAAVIPDYSFIEQDEKEFILRMGQEDSLIHAGKTYGRRFDSFDELIDFSGTLDTSKKLEDTAVDSSRVLFETSWGGIKQQVDQALQNDNILMHGTTNPGLLVASYSLGRLCASNELLIKASRLGGTPILEVPTSWQYLNWKIEYDAQRRGDELNLKDLHVLKGLQGLGENEMEWLGKIPPSALIELRTVGALGEIREIMSTGIDSLVKANPANYYRTADQVFDNIHDALAEHRKKVEELKTKKWKFAGTDIGSWFVVGSMAITAAATGVPAWAVGAVIADQLLDAPKLKSIPGSIKELAKASSELDKSPVGILYRYNE